MRAKLIEYNFERGRDPKGKLGVGYGPAKPQYIEDFEKAMDDFGIIIKKEALDGFPNIITWTIEGPGDIPQTILDKTIFLFTESDSKGRLGWSFNPITAYTKESRKFYDTPYPIIKFIVETYHGDIEGHIRALKDALNEYESIKEKMSIWSKKWS